MNTDNLTIAALAVSTFSLGIAILTFVMIRRTWAVMAAIDCRPFLSAEAWHVWSEDELNRSMREEAEKHAGAGQ
jgi:hypothetical protein